MALKAKRYTVTAALPLYKRSHPHWSFGWCLCPRRYLCALPACTKKQRCRFICGSDEHGVAISIRAKKEVSPKDIIDKYDTTIKTSFEQLGISFDNYSRTSAPIHHETAGDFFKQMHQEGKFI